jgi:hypothetical protein
MELKPRKDLWCQFEMAVPQLLVEASLQFSLGTYWLRLVFTSSIVPNFCSLVAFCSLREIVLSYVSQQIVIVLFRLWNSGVKLKFFQSFTIPMWWHFMGWCKMDLVQRWPLWQSSWWMALLDMFCWARIGNILFCLGCRRILLASSF